MSSKFLKMLIVVLAAIMVVAYVFYLNPAAVKVNLGGDRSWEGPLAQVLIVVFCLGFLFSTAFASVITARQKLNEWRDRKRYRALQDNHALIVAAREQIAAGNYRSAAMTLSKAVAVDPDNVIARILAADVFRREGDINGALAVLDEARQSQKRNVELLLVASSIHEEAGNLTAAYDNTAMVLDSQPTNQFALAKLVDYSLGLSRYERAIEYQKELVRLASGANLEQRQMKLAQIELDRALYSFDDRMKLKTGLDEVLRRHRDFPPALAALADAERATGNVDQAVKLWTKAFKQTGDVKFLCPVVETWLELDQPQKATAAAKSGADTFGQDGKAIAARLLAANTLLYLEDIEQAEEELERLQSLPDAGASAEQIKLLKAKILRRRGMSNEASDVLLNLTNPEYALPGDGLFCRLAQKKPGSGELSWAAQTKTAAATQPPPALSTP